MNQHLETVSKSSPYMNTKLSFKTQITWLSTSLILLTVIFLTISNWFRFADYAEAQIEQKIVIAQNVLNQTLSLQEQVLITSASVLAADFGFKQAIATGDKQTIKSVLLNHGKRINADLMLILDLGGNLLTSSSRHSFSPQMIKSNINKLPFRDVHAKVLSIENKVFQVIVVPVKAPRTIAYTVIGFEFDNSMLLQLKDLISLDVSLVQKKQIIESSINDVNIRQQALLSTPQLENTSLSETIKQSQAQQSPNLLLTRSDYYHKSIKFSSSSDVYAILSTSLVQIQSDFNQLILSMLIIALVVIIIAFILSRVLSQGLSAPIKNLMDITKRIGQGELEVPKLSNNLPAEFTDLYEGFVVMGTAIEHREQAITYQAERDTLTGLFNRYKVLSKVSDYVDNNISLLLITFNIKDFKSFNDTIGVNNADSILVEIAQRLNAYIETTTQRILGNNGFAARINSDEFLLCLPIGNTKSANKITEQLRIEIERPLWISGIKINLVVYYGIANSIDHGTDAEKLIRRSAMAASAAYKDQISVKSYQKGEDENYLYRLHLIEELKVALENPNSPLFMNYQPKLNIATGKVDKLEALIRWINNEDKFVNPELFVGLAEQAGLIITLTQWVILQVVKQVDQWNQLGYHFQVSINVSTQDIQNNQFIDYLLATLNKYNVAATQITLELTERDLAEDEILVERRLHHLKSLGFEVSVDDYGIGQSSLAKLKNLPVDELKIDKTFILKLDQCQQDQYIVASTISLGHKLGLRVVAEGVENNESLKLLRQFQCDYAQGYYLSRPMSAEKFIEWYESNEYPY
jgi:diguanylate cyclase (GGDEF)-like protein